MLKLPPPGNFAEGQRQLYGLLAAAAGMFCGAMAVAMIGLLMWGGWSKAEEHTIVVIFGCTLGGFVAAMTAVIVGLLAGGPVGRLKVSATRDGASFEADRDPGGSSVTTTTTVTPAPAKAADPPAAPKATDPPAPEGVRP
jgi:hypothetical protein